MALSADTPTVPGPRLSILIPNFNNGRESSADGEQDFIGDLMASLSGTLEGDPTPVEILVADDGSTDDSLETCRRWARKIRSDGSPFCRLLEAGHSGVLSVVANRLTRVARGDICCRLDGDVRMLTPGWAGALCRLFDAAPPGVGIIGAKQLGPDGRIHSAGDWVLHPHGYHHVARGARRDAVSRTIEVDHVMGCFYAYRREVWTALDGFDETLGRGQTVDFSLRARLRGWRVLSTPVIEFEHRHRQRRPRRTRADAAEGVAESQRRFQEKWGFDRLAPDLAAVAERYAGTPLLWNAEVFGPVMEWPRPAPGPLEIGATDWARFAERPGLREALLWRAGLVEAAGGRIGPRRRVVHWLSRSGLLCHLLAGRGVPCLGIDPDPAHVALAESITRHDDYPPGARPAFAAQAGRDRLPVEPGAADTIMLTDVLDHHCNPVALYREAHRVLAPGGVLIAVAAGPGCTGDETLAGWRRGDLATHLQSSGLFEPLDSAAAGGTVAVTARRVARPAATIEVTPAATADMLQ